MEETEKLQPAKVMLSPREIIQKYLRFLPWVIISVAVAYTIAWINLLPLKKGWVAMR